MSNLLTALPTGVAAFIATNLDDIIILLLLFSQVNRSFQRRHVVMGQYLGFTSLVLMSMPGFLGGQLLPQTWIGMLGIVPIAIGVNRLLSRDQDEESEPDLTIAPSASPFTSFLSPQTCSIAAITVANGGDNIGIYMPLFASCTVESLLVILSVFLSLVGVWCYTAYQLTRVPMIAEILTRYGNLLVPFVLIGLGLMILLESHTLEDQSLSVLTLIVSAIAMVMMNHKVLLPQKN
ncbi:cadmium resistance transporter [Leptolyngbya sp. 7M]|uniref:cadmium resistance transporter n=1 Tax=Leptolyngbya sp. 7M TaxID=2812896 RepID=UPI001B8B3E39|nr:cadmium resistance transporter [Leptolyngbya sp. 7M]QYO62615.1 cadmium resistance transporter [Leptolyngbya sp. 7M]